MNKQDYLQLLVSRIKAVTLRIEELTKKGNAHYGVKLPPVNLRFDLRGKCAGQAGMMSDGSLYIRFNTDMMVSDSWDHIFNDTTPHELAHSFCQAFPKLGKDHNTGWKRVCIALGGSGKRTHNETVVYAKGKTYEYITSTGHKTTVSQTLHRRIQAGQLYRVKDRGILSSACKFEEYKKKVAV